MKPASPCEQDKSQMQCGNIGENGRPIKWEDNNGYKCIHSKTEIGRSWGGLCPAHEWVKKTKARLGIK